jgi:hypothetical protein
MRRLVILCSLLCLPGPAFGGEAEDILARARKAQVADADTAEAVVKIKGRLEAAGQPVAIEGEFAVRPGDRDTLRLAARFPSAQIQFWVIYAQKTVTREVDGGIAEVTPSEYIETVRTLEPLRAALYSALLHAPATKMVVLEGSKVGDRAAIPVRITLANQTERTFFFDKQTGCLLKVALPDQKIGPKPLPVEIVFSGHAETNLGAADERLLSQAGVKTDAASVAAFLRKQTPEMATTEKIKALIAKLGHDEFDVREQATKDVAALGAPALPLLEEATKSDDPEVSRRAEYAVAQIKARNTNATTIAAVRVLARRDPANAAEVLLNALGAADKNAAAEIHAALAAVARRDGKTDPVLEKALTDKDAVKRTAAEMALGKDGGEYLKKPGRRLYPGTCAFPAKAAVLVDGKTVVEIEFVEVQFVNRLDDRAFAIRNQGKE